MAAQPGAFSPADTAMPSSRVELRISCTKLRDADVFSKSDPIVAVHCVSKRGGWQEYDRTEMIKNTLNPEFAKVIKIQYRFEEMQKLKFTVYDIDNETDSLGDDDFLGSLECTLGEIVSAATYTKPLKYKEKDCGQITIHAEEVSQNESLIDLKFSAKSLDKKDMFGKSDPYLEFAKRNPDGSYSVVHRTEVIKNTLNPLWTQFSISTNTLCGSDPDRSIKVTCYDWDSDGSHDLIGEFSTSLAELQTTASTAKKLQWDVINPSKRAKKRSYANSGTVSLDHARMVKLYSFLDYIMGGCQINFTVAVDFTASNGDPSKPSSLHFIDPYAPNEYTKALVAVGEVCQDYDSDKLFPALGFGGQIGGQVSHEFALNGHPENPYCTGIPGVVAAYHQSLKAVRLYGPTNMAPVINHVARFAEQASGQSNQNYYVLLILTDGEITDMADTKRAVIRASRLPMSIIIVGVGICAFEKMVELDADEQKLSMGSEVAERDIVQFVPFRQFSNATPAVLASQVLAEVPGQLTEFMRKRNIVPVHATR